MLALIVHTIGHLRKYTVTIESKVDFIGGTDMGKFVVIDLEMCKTSKLYKKTFSYAREIIQVGAVMMNENLEIVDEFNEYVKPQYGDLDQFIKKLTGITKKDLSGAPKLEEVFKHFTEWLPQEDFVMISWSMTDKSQLSKELEFKGISTDEMFQHVFETWVDCQPQFSEKLGAGNRCYALQEALIATDICSDGRAHDGLADARNTALLYAKMQKEEKLVLNPYYKKAHEEQTECLTYSLADMMRKALAGAC